MNIRLKLGVFFVSSFYGSGFCFEFCIGFSFFCSFSFSSLCGLFFELSFFSFGCAVTNVVDCFAVEVNSCETGTLTGAATEVAEVVAAYLGTLGNFDLQDERAVEQEALFNADTACDLANSDAARQALLAVTTDNDTLKNLGSLFVTFFNLLVHTYGVARTDVDDLALHVLLVDFLN